MNMEKNMATETETVVYAEIILCGFGQQRHLYKDPYISTPLLGASFSVEYLLYTKLAGHFWG